LARSTALARLARQSNCIHDRLARRAIWHLREETLRAAVVNLLHPTERSDNAWLVPRLLLDRYPIEGISPGPIPKRASFV
jgi:hypothetical protein